MQPIENEQPKFGQREVWLKTADGIIRKEIKTGLNDGINTIVTEGLNNGDTIVLSASVGKKNAPNEMAANPLMPQRPGRR